LSNVPAHLYRCAGEKTGFVRSHNAIARVLHDASKAAKLAVVREPSVWVAGTQAFGHGLDGPKKRPDLLIHTGQEKALVVDVTVTAGTLVSNAGRASRFPQFPLEKREADRIRVYQKSSATMSNMSNHVKHELGGALCDDAFRSLRGQGLRTAADHGQTRVRG